MTGIEIGLLATGLIVLLLLVGMPVPLAFIGVSFIGVWLLRGDMSIAMKMLGLSATDTIADYLFVVIPLFVLMGLLVMQAGLGRDSYDVANRVTRRLPGGLGVSTVGANAIFAAITGISVASAAVFTKVAVPEMLRYGYSKRFAMGVVAGSSVLGMLIPPSLLLIIFGILAETSIEELFLGGILPGLLLTTAFGLMIVSWAVLRPAQFGGGAASIEGSSGQGLVWAARLLAPIVVLVGIVLGGLYGGFFTASEGGAIGAAAALLIALLRGSLTWRSLWRVLLDAGASTTSLLLLIIGANLYSRVLAMTGVPMAIGDWFAHLDIGLYGMLAIYLGILILLGFMMDSTSILFIVVPIALPVFLELGADLVWLGILTVLTIEIGLITPPFGLSAFVVKASVEDHTATLGDVFVGAAPFALAMILIVILLAAFPPIATVFG